MKELLNNFKETMMKGIVLWVLAHLILYVLCSFQNAVSFYDAQINKLHNPTNFAIQILYSGLLYTGIEVTFKFFVDNIFKYSVKKESRKVFTNALIAVIIMALVCGAALYTKKTDIVNKTITKIMILIIFVRGMAGVVATVADNSLYNNKLKAKNREE